MFDVLKDFMVHVLMKKIYFQHSQFINNNFNYATPAGGVFCFKLKLGFNGKISTY